MEENKAVKSMSTTHAVFIAIFIGMVVFVLAFNTTALFDMLPDMAHDLKLTLSQTQWLINSYMITCTALILLGGELGDFFHKKIIFSIGCIGFAVASVIVGFSFNLYILFAGRVLQGVFLAVTLPSTIELLKVSIPQEKQVLAFGVWSALVGVGFAFGPTLGGIITVLLSWRMVFFVAAVIMIISLIVSLFLMPKYKIPTKLFKLDWIGLILFVVGISSTTIGLMQAQVWGWIDIKTLSCIIGGIVLLIIFFFVEAYVEDPFIPLRNFRNPMLMSSCIGNFANGYIIATVLSYIMIFLQDPMLVHENALVAGLSLLPFSIAVFVLSLCMDSIRKVIPSLKKLLLIGFLSFILAQIIIMFVHHDSDIWSVLLALLFFGIGVGFLQSNLPKMAADSVVPERVGEATGLNWTIFYFGAVFGIILCGIVYDNMWRHIFTTHLTESHVSLLQQHNIMHLLATTKHNIVMVLPHVRSNLSNVIIPAYQHASVSSLKIIMAMSGFIIVFLLIATYLLASISEKSTPAGKN